jgi:hypothetical protein
MATAAPNHQMNLTIADLNLMKTPFLIVLPIACLLFAGCRSMPGAAASIPATSDYSAKEPLATSLFPSDQAVLGALKAAADDLVSFVKSAPRKGG